MRAFAQTQNQTQEPTSYDLAGLNRKRRGPGGHEHTALRTRSEPDGRASAPPPLSVYDPSRGYDLSRVPARRAAPSIQKKLAVGGPGDEYEVEADRVSRQVMLMPAPQPGAACECAGKCPRCQAGPKGEGPRRLQTRRVGAAGAGRAEAPPIVNEVLAGPGRPLDSSARRFLEPRFGHDFGDVRVHADARASESADAVGASAYTVGRHMVFAAGRYAPDTPAGLALLAHELTHTLQQGAGRPARSPDAGGDAAEGVEASAQVLQMQSAPGGDLPCPRGEMRLGPGTPCVPVTLPGRDCPIGQIRMAPDLPCFPWRERPGLLPGTLRPPVLTPPNVGQPGATDAGTTPAGSTSSGGASPCAAPAVTRTTTSPSSGCRYTVTYSNCREVDCDTIWRGARGTNPPGPLCGAAVVYDITSVTASGTGCPRTLEGLTVSETVRGDHGCTPPGYVWPPPRPCVIGPGGTVTGCTDTYSLCGLTSALGGSCTEVVTQEITVGGRPAETHHITFDLNKDPGGCRGSVRRD